MRALPTEQITRMADVLAEAWAARADEHDRAGVFPSADIDDLRSSGLLGLMTPQHLGGLGGSFADYVQVSMRLARASGASALLFNMHASVTGALSSVPDELASALGVDESFFATRDALLAAAAAGSMYGVAISERRAGSRLSAIATTYATEGDGFRIRGYKSTCSGAGHLDAYLVAARDVAGADAAEPRISYFVVPGSSIGQVEQTWDPLGMRATVSNGFELDAFVDRSALVGVEAVATFLAYAMPEWLVASYAAVYVGVAEAALDAAVAYVRSTEVSAPADGAASQRVSLGSSPWVRQRIGRAEAQVHSARLVLEDAAAHVVERPGDPATNRAIYRAKLVAGDTAFAVAGSLTEACGLGALMRGGPLERLLRDARSGAVMPPSSDIAANVVGASLLDMELAGSLGERPW